MMYLYQEFYIKKNRGFSEAEFQTALETFLGQDMDDFFKKYVNGTEPLDFANVFPKVGLNVNYVGKPTPSFGAVFAQEGGKCIVKSVRAGGPAETAGISVNDEIIGCNGMRVDKNTLDNFLNSLIAGEFCEIIVSREDVIFNVSVKMEGYEKPMYKLEMQSPSSEKFYYWLRALD
jgi:predicted metalloprotease with PDZ domain